MKNQTSQPQGTTTAKVYDVVFEDSNDSNNKGFEETFEYCLDYIRKHNGTGESYFGDYIGGQVVILNNATGKIEYSEEVV